MIHVIVGDGDDEEAPGAQPRPRSSVPAMWRMWERTMTTTIRNRKIIAGCGTLFPTRSTTSNIRFMTPLFGSADCVLSIILR